MCHADADSPPALPGERQRAGLESIVLGAEPLRAAHARPDSNGDVAVLVVPDGRGLHPFYERLALEFARVGIEALAIDLYGRTAGTGPRDGAFVSRGHSARLTWDGVRADLAEGVARLRADDPSRRVVAVGFCLGGRVTLLAATVGDLALSGAVAFYPQTTGPARSDLPAPDERIEQLTCPVLCLFGDADELIPSGAVRSWRAALASAPTEHDVVVYPGAPHSFFDRSAERFEAIVADAAERVTTFVRASA